MMLKGEVSKSSLSAVTGVCLEWHGNWGGGDEYSMMEGVKGYFSGSVLISA